MPDHAYHRIARLILVAFVFTFIAARVLVFLIMSRRIPDLYLRVHGTHVHHLNYGIILLSVVGGLLLFIRPRGRLLTTIALMYGIGLALTFDEFGMWLHLGGAYWQRASFDAVVVIAALLASVAFAPSLKHFRPRHWSTAVVMMISVAIFVVLLVDSFRYARDSIVPKLHEVESAAPQ